MAKKYYWLQLKSTFFSNRIAKKLLKAERGKIYALIYLKMLLFSVDKEGHLFFEGVEHTFAEEIALVLDEELEDVKTTIETLESAGAMEQIAADEWYLTEMPELIGKECDSAERVRKHRAKTLQCNTNVTECNTDVTECNTEKRREEIEKSREENTKSKGECERENRKRFVPPTVGEAIAYCVERGNDIDAQQFIDFYASKGWMVGKNKMTDWKAAVRTWEKYHKKKQNTTQSKGAEELNGFYNMVDNWVAKKKGENA